MELIDFAIKIAEKAGRLTVKGAKKTLTVSEKAKNDLVTNVDKASEKLIIDSVKAKYPDHDFLAEESSGKNQVKAYEKSEYIWIIDPLDGTLNFCHKIPLYSVSIAIFEKKKTEKSKNFEYMEGEIVAGVINIPMLNETYYAEKGKGAYLNGKKISVSEVRELDDAMTVTGYPPKHKEINLPYFERMLTRSQAGRRTGSAALDLAWLACGRFDAFWEFGLKPWDIAAGALIVEEAGGKVTDTNGNLLDLFGQDIIATNKLLHRRMISEFAGL